jgi:hypothetical protein
VGKEGELYESLSAHDGLPLSATRWVCKRKGEKMSECRTIFKSSHYAIDIETFSVR